MNLVLHQFRLEIKRSRIGLLLYFLVLACNFMVAAGLLSAPEINQHGSWKFEGMLPTFAVIGYWIALVLLVANCILADSPARQDRFLTTRPLSTKSLLAAKGLYILLATLLPAVLIEILSAATVDGLSGLSLLAGLERFLFAGSIALVVAAFAAHWKNSQGFIIAIAVGFGLLMVLGRLGVLLFMAVMEDTPNPFSREPSFLTSIQALFVLGLGLCLTAWVCARRGRKFRYLIPSLIPITIVVLFVASKSPLRTMPFRPTDQAALDLLLAEGAGVKVFPRGMSIGSLKKTPELSANYSATPIISDLPREMELRWFPADYEWMVDGKSTLRVQNDANALGRTFVSLDSVPISWPLAQTVQEHLQETVVFRLGLDRSYRDQSATLSSPQALRYLPDGPLAGKDAQLRMRMIGDAVRWHVVADLPLKEGASHKEFGSAWKIAIFRREHRDLNVLLSERTLALHTAGNPKHRNLGARWREHYSFVLYLPSEKVALFGGVSQQRAAAGVSATKRYLGELKFPNGRGNTSITAESLSGARLLIMEAELVGRVTHDWESPKFELRSRTSQHGGGTSKYEEHEKLSSAEFAFWFERLKKISPDAGDPAVHQHLELLLEQVDRVRNRITNQREPAIVYTATFVPEHLAHMLDLLPTLTFRQRAYLLESIKQGAQDDQRHPIISAIMDRADLSTIYEIRGWNQDARESYISMVQNSRNAGHRFLPKLIAMDDPSLDALILDAYRIQPQANVYHALQGIPRLSAAAEKITDELWRPGRLVLERNEPRGMILFALLQGKREALDELFTILNIVDPKQDSNNWNLSSLIRSSFQIPKSATAGGGNSQEKVLTWMRHYEASDFLFDPIFRRFVLKIANKTT